jgi:hypothetical protein
MEIEFGLAHAHVLALFATAIFLALADFEAARYILGKRRFLDRVQTERLRKSALFGLFIVIISGAFLFKNILSFVFESPALYGQLKNHIVSLRRWRNGKFFKVQRSQAFCGYVLLWWVSTHYRKQYISPRF